MFERGMSPHQPSTIPCPPLPKEEVKENKTKVNWISVDDRLPNKYEPVLINTLDYVAFAYWDGKHWRECNGDELEGWVVTHWGPVVERPEGE